MPHQQTFTPPLRIGTRGSQLALAQAYELRRRICASTGVDETAVEIVVISTTGDRVTDRPLAEIGGKGLFTLEIEEQLSDGRIDMAVHSSKDMPTVLPEGLELSCFLPRESVADAFVSRTARRFGDLAKGAVVGTSSLRRQAQLLRVRPDLTIVGFRGNVQTRLRKLEEGVAEATLLAHAGLKRLEMDHVVCELLPLDEFVPAPGQGAICVETRTGDAVTEAVLGPINDGDTAIALSAERAFLRVLDGSCRTPLAGHAKVDGTKLHFHGVVLSPDGSKVHETRMSADLSEAIGCGEAAGEKLRKDAGAGFFSDWS
ncbi:MAG: hydroxymethylbilane synthase [Rhizobiaceae bacterium]